MKADQTTQAWWKQLDPMAVQKAMETACQDCYDAEEQCSGLQIMIENNTRFPFKVRVLGEVLEATGSKFAADDRAALDLVIQRDGQQYPIEIRSVEICEPLPEGHLNLAAYLYWKSTL
jgi:hypothetical protein